MRACWHAACPLTISFPPLPAGGGAESPKDSFSSRIKERAAPKCSLYHSAQGPDGKLALDVILRSMAYVMVLGGIPSLPFLDDLMDMLEKFFGRPFRSEARAQLRQNGGPALERLGFAGIPALIGVDVPGSLKTGIPFIGERPAETVYGVYGGLARKALNSYESAEREQYLRALEFASPVFLESMFKAYRTFDEGARTPHGKVLFDDRGKPIRATAGEAIAQTAGFRPARMAALSGEYRSRQNLEEHYRELRSDIYDRFALAKNEEDRRRVIKDAQKFNLQPAKYRGVIRPITGESLRQSLLRRVRPEKQGVLFGRLMEGNDNMELPHRFLGSTEAKGLNFPQI